MTKAQPPRAKHVPQRTCIACRKVDAKRGLVRLVRLPDEHIAIDATGKRAGRGAYVCRERGCWVTAFKRKAIERALKIAQIAPEDAALLHHYHLDLPHGSDEDKVEPLAATMPV